MSYKVRHPQFDEVKATVENGDTDLNEYRGKYKKLYDTDTKLDDDQLINVIAIAEPDGEIADIEMAAAMHDAEIELRLI